MNSKMDAAGKALNLKGHPVGISSDSRGFFYLPTDIEGHRGSDGRYYVLDFSRVFPPTRPRKG